MNYVQFPQQEKVFRRFGAKRKRANRYTVIKNSIQFCFGYYIEVRNTHKDKVPDTWIRKQTLVNAERYITEELKSMNLKY